MDPVMRDLNDYMARQERLAEIEEQEDQAEREQFGSLLDSPEALGLKDTMTIEEWEAREAAGESGARD